jgi:hypothetical protein
MFQRIPQTQSTNLLAAMKPLTVVSPLDLQVGEKYLIEYVGQHKHSSPRCKATFVGNIMPECQFHCIQSKFNNMRDNMVPTIKSDFEFKLQDCFYKYYKADAVTRAYTRHVLRTITGDPDFEYEYT